MVAGLNVRFRIWRYTAQNDDAVGGAILSGTVSYDQVQARFQSNPLSQLLLQQGLEANRTYSAVIVPGTLDVRERDEVEVIQPLDHVYYGQRFRIVGMQYSDHNRRDPRNYIMLTMSRSDEAHAHQ